MNNNCWRRAAHLTYVHLMYTHLTSTTSTSMFRNPSPSPSDTPYNVNVVNDNCWQWGCSFNVRSFDVHTNVVNNNCWQTAAFNIRAFDVHTFDVHNINYQCFQQNLGGEGIPLVPNPPFQTHLTVSTLWHLAECQQSYIYSPTPGWKYTYFKNKLFSWWWVGGWVGGGGGGGGGGWWS